MPVTDVKKDLDALAMSITAEFDAGAERVWGLWSDPRQLERWWGPPSFPATFVDHDLSPGGRGMEQGLREAVGQIDAILGERT